MQPHYQHWLILLHSCKDREEQKRQLSVALHPIWDDALDKDVVTAREHNKVAVWQTTDKQHVRKLQTVSVSVSH